MSSAAATGGNTSTAAIRDRVTATSGRRISGGETRSASVTGLARTTGSGAAMPAPRWLTMCAVNGGRWPRHGAAIETASVAPPSQQSRSRRRGQVSPRPRSRRVPRV
jgi:hypothetical protein